MNAILSIIFMLPLWTLFVSGESKICGGNCCSGYKWNKDRTSCIPCDVGFYERNCSKKCRYPSFGLLCQSKCTCPEGDCDPSRGCPVIECPVGLSGAHCEFSCKFPNYGLGCQKECLCSKDACNPATGCANLSETTTQKIVTPVSTLEVWKAELRSSTISPLHSYLKTTSHTPKHLKKETECPSLSYWTSLEIRAKTMLLSIIILGTISLIFILLYALLLIFF